MFVCSVGLLLHIRPGHGRTVMPSQLDVFASGERTQATSAIVTVNF
jgi:hypothetical protein